MRKRISVTFSGSGEERLNSLVKKTGKDTKHVLMDAIRVYEWIVDRHCEGKSFKIVDGEHEEIVKIVGFEVGGQ